jgi:excisionase family DNA binding protein
MALKDRYSTISEVAKELEVSRQTVYRWVADHQIPAEKVGGVTLIKKTDVKRYIDRQETETGAKMLDRHISDAFRRKFGYSNEDKMERIDEEDHIGYRVTHKNGKSEIVRASGVTVTVHMAGVDKDFSILDVILHDTSKTEEIQKEQEKKEKAK